MNFQPQDPGYGFDAAPGMSTTAPPLRPLRARLRAAASIPPRPWLYGTHALRGFVTVLVAAGGTGKSMWALTVACSMATGRALLGQHVHAQANAWYLNLEDPLDEIDRRLAATAIKHGLQDEELAGRLFLNSGRDRRLCIAAKGENGATILYPDKAAVIEGCLENRIGVIVVDPFVKSHGLEENSNGDMDAAVTAWSEIASEANCAVILVHHTRKGSTVDVEAARGGKALTDGARVALTMCSMQEDEAERLGVPVKERLRYVRLDDAKANLAARAIRATWFAIEAVDLGNGTSEYPEGDRVATLVSWTPPSAFEGMTDQQANEVLDRIHEGFEPGIPFSPSNAGKSTRWAGVPVMEAIGCDEAQAKRIIGTWIENKVLSIIDCQDGKRRTRKGITVNDAKRPGPAA